MVFNRINEICPFCDSLIQDFRSHITAQDSDVNNDDLRTCCKFCDLVVKNQECLEKHEKNVHGSLYYGISCLECNIDFTSPAHLEIHEQLFHNEEIQSKIQAFDGKVLQNDFAVPTSPSYSPSAFMDWNFFEDDPKDEKLKESNSNIQVIKELLF